MAEDQPIISTTTSEQADAFAHRAAVVEMNEQAKQDKPKKPEAKKTTPAKTTEQQASSAQRQIQTSEDIRDALQDEAYLDSIQEKSLTEIQEEIGAIPLEDRSVAELVALSLALERWYGEHFEELKDSDFPDVVSNVHDPIAMRQTIANVLENKGIDLNAQLALGAFTFENSSAPSGAEAGAGPAGVTPVYLVPEVDVRSLPFVDTIQILETMNRRYASNRAEPRELNDARMHVLNKIGMATTNPALQRKLSRMAHRLEIAREKLENRENARSILEKKIDIRSRARAEEDAGRFVVPPGQTIEAMNLLDVITQLAGNRSNEDILLEWQETLSAFTPDQTKLIYGERETDFVKNLRPAIDLFANAIRDNRKAQEDKQAYLAELARRKQIESDFKKAMIAELHSGDVGRIEQFIDAQFNGSNYSFSQERFNDLVEISLDKRSFDTEMYGYAIEYAMEQILKKSDLLPNSGFVQPSFEEGIYLSKLRTATMRMADQDERHVEMFKYLSELQEVRHVVHELYNTRKDFETKKKFIASAVRPERMQYAENEIPGVLYYLNIAEKYYGMAVAKQRNYLLKENLEEVDKEIGLAMNAALVNGQLEREIEVSGWGTKKRKLTESEKDRAMVMGTKAMAISQRRVAYSTLGEVPKGGVDFLRSLDSEQEAQRVGPLKILHERFLRISSNVAAAFFKEVKFQINEDAHIRGLRYDIGRKMNDGVTNKGLYGNSEESWLLTHSRVWDPKSNGWRGRNLFIDNTDYTPVYDPHSGDLIGSVVRYVDDEWAKVEGLKGSALQLEYQAALLKLSLRSPGAAADETLYCNNNDIKTIRKETRMKQVIFSEAIRDRILEQRLSLAAVVREANFTPRLRADIWENVADLLPSRIIAFFPDETREILEQRGFDPTDQNELLGKLFLAEMDRVLNDRHDINHGANPAGLDPLSDYFNTYGITHMNAKGLDEIDALAEISKFGKAMSPILATIPFNYIAFLDDAVACWDELDDRDIDRVFVGDQESFAVGYSKLGANITKPEMPDDQSEKNLVEAKDAMAGPLGLDACQDMLEPWVVADAVFHEMDIESKLGSHSIRRALGMPTSPVEQKNPTARISRDERATAARLGNLAAQQVINNEQDNVNKRDIEFLTQLDRIKKKTKARVFDLLIMYGRMLALLFPVTFVAELLGISTKDLGLA